jgi:hypothetical protein
MWNFAHQSRWWRKYAADPLAARHIDPQLMRVAFMAIS